MIIVNGIHTLPKGDYKEKEAGDSNSDMLQQAILKAKFKNNSKSTVIEDKSNCILLPPEKINLKEAKEIAKRLSKPLSVVKIAMRRGVDENSMLEYFDPSLSELSPISSLRNAKEFQDFLVEKVLLEKKHSAIFYDYDVDGIASGVMLHDFIRAFKFGGRVTMCPSNRKVGYGTSNEMIQDAWDKGARVFFMLDFGTFNNEQIDLIHSLGGSVAIIDHHHFTKDHVNKADIFVNPMVDRQGFEGYCAGGLVGRVLLDLASRVDQGEYKRLKALDSYEANKNKTCSDIKILSALSTIADMMLLKDDARRIVYEGLEEFNMSETVWVRAFKKVIGKYEIIANDVGFGIGAMINAPGRMLTEDGAAVATDFFLEPRVQASLIKAMKIWDVNLKRREATGENTQEAEKTLIEYLSPDLSFAENFEVSTKLEISDKLKIIEKSIDIKNLPAILVIEIEDGNPGVLGIAAARLTEKYNRPVVLVTKNQDGILTGSARSLKHKNHSFDLVSGLKDSSVSKHLISVGGHTGAAGLSLKKESFQDSKLATEKVFKKQMGDRDITPIVQADIEMTLEDLHKDYINYLKDLSNNIEPCGYGNESSLIYIRKAKILNIHSFMGERKEVLSFLFAQNKEGTDYTEGILWSDTIRKFEVGDTVNLIVGLEIDDDGSRYRYNDSRKKPKLTIIAIEKS